MVWINARSIPSLLAAAALFGLGLVAMRQPLQLSENQRLASSGRPDLAAVDAALQEREITLHQRREAEALLGQFIRGQMTRHYWGHFASSLIDLGLDSGSHLRARVISSPTGTELWLTPRRGGEAYAAAVRQKGPRVVRWQCRGPLPKKDLRLSLVRGCPAGWVEIEMPQP